MRPRIKRLAATQVKATPSGTSLACTAREPSYKLDTACKEVTLSALIYQDHLTQMPPAPTDNAPRAPASKPAAVGDTLRICVLSPAYPPGNGVTSALKLLDRALKPYPVHLQYITCVQEDLLTAPDWLPKENLFYYHAFHIRRPFPFILGFIQLLLHLRRNRIQVAHAHHNFFALLLAPFQRLLGFRTVLTYHFAAPPPFWFQFCLPRYATSVSQSGAEAPKRGDPTKTVHVIGHALDFPDAPPSWQPETLPPVACCIARLEPVKGHALLLQAWRKLLDRGTQARLLLLGDGSLRASLEALHTQLQLGDSVQFLGLVSHPEETLQGCRFHILTSECEGLPVAIAEASALGRPTLLTDVPGNRDSAPLPGQLILPNRIPYANVDLLTDALQTWFAASGDALRKDGEQFFHLQKKLNSRQAVGAAFYHLYQKAAAEL